MFAQQYLPVVITCTIASVRLFERTSAQETYGDMDDATINGAATACLDPMVAAFNAEIEKEDDKCPTIKLQCDRLNVITKQSITVNCVDGGGKRGTELTGSYSVLGACIVPGSPDGSGTKALAVALELFDRMCDDAVAPDAQIIDSDAKAFLDGLKPKLQKELKSPADATAIVAFTVDQVIKAIIKEGQCAGASVTCKEADFYGGTLPILKFNKCPKSSFMTTTKLAIDRVKSWKKTLDFGMYLSRDTVRRFREIAPQDNKGLRISKLLSALRQTFCPAGKRGITTSFNEVKITAAAKTIAL